MTLRKALVPTTARRAVSHLFALAGMPIRKNWNAVLAKFGGGKSADLRAEYYSTQNYLRKSRPLNTTPGSRSPSVLVPS